jgi:hypothetical protein
MRNKGRTVWSFGACVLLGALGCEGGQTGDIGAEVTCCFFETETFTLEEGKALDPDVPAALEAAFGSTGSRRLELMLFGPPALWTARDREPPSDRATPITVTMAPAGTVLRHRSKPIPDSLCAYECGDEATDIVMDVAIELPDLGVAHAGTGTLRVPATGDEAFLLFSIVVPELDGCALELTLDSGRSTIWCNRRLTDSNITGSSTCLDREAWLPLPRDPRTGLNVKELLELGLASLPVELRCDSQRTVSLASEHFGAALPDRYCADFAPPAIVRLDSPVVEDAGLLSEWMSLKTDSICDPRECTQPEGCHTVVDESDSEPTPRCTTAHLVAATGKSFHRFWVQVEDDGTMIAAASVYSMYEAVCHGQRRIE